MTAIQMVTLNTAECFRLRNIGAIAPGIQADFLLLENLEELVIHQVYKKGTCIVNQGELNGDHYLEKPRRFKVLHSLRLTLVR